MRRTLARMTLVIFGLALLVAAVALAVAADRKPWQATANAVALVTIGVAVLVFAGA